MTDTSATLGAATSAVLRRGVMARLRTIRFYEIASWIAIAALVFGRRQAFALEDLGLWLVGLAGVAVRLAIATESVRCDGAGISWRSLFVTHRVGWDEISGVDVAARPMNIRFVRGISSAMSPCLVIERGARGPLYVTPSLLVPLMRLGEFVSAARLMSPVDWSLLDRAGDGHDTVTERRPSGKRVGRPTRPRDR